AILRVVEMDARRLRGQALTPRRVLGEERAEVRLPDLLLMGLERLPRLARSQWQRFRHGSSFSVSWPCRGWQVATLLIGQALIPPARRSCCHECPGFEAGLQ